MGDVLAVAVASGVFISLLALADASSRRWKVEPEVARKSAHVSCGVVAACLPLVMGFGGIAVLALLFVPFMLAARRVDLFPSLHAVERSTLGEMYFPLGVLLVALAFPHAVPYAYGVLVMGVSDAAASLAGQRYGNRAYRLVTAWKTYVGSAAFFATTLVLSVVALALAGTGWMACLLAASGLATVLTAAEGALGGGTDNLVLPVLAAAALTLLGP